jgi:hypothetical protein
MRTQMDFGTFVVTQTIGIVTIITLAYKLFYFESQENNQDAQALSAIFLATVLLVCTHVVLTPRRLLKKERLSEQRLDAYRRMLYQIPVIGLWWRWKTPRFFQRVETEFLRQQKDLEFTAKACRLEELSDSWRNTRQIVEIADSLLEGHPEKAMETVDLLCEVLLKLKENIERERTETIRMKAGLEHEEGQLLSFLRDPETKNARDKRPAVESALSRAVGEIARNINTASKSLEDLERSTRLVDCAFECLSGNTENTKKISRSMGEALTP